jgi:hypothetical protein
MLGDATGAVQDQRTPLVLQAVRFAFALPNLEWFILEQVPALEYMWEDIAAETSPAATRGGSRAGPVGGLWTER